MFFYLLFDGSNCKSEWSLSTCQIIKNPKHIGFERLSSRVFLKNYLGAFKSFSRFMDWIFVERMKVQPRLHVFPFIFHYYILYISFNFRLWRTSQKTSQIQKDGMLFKISFCIPNEPKRCPLPLLPIRLQETKEKNPTQKFIRNREDGTLCGTISHKS